MLEAFGLPQKRTDPERQAQKKRKDQGTRMQKKGDRSIEGRELRKITIEMPLQNP